MQKRQSFIDALRGLAVFGVVLVHVGQRVPILPEWFKNITDQGARGVQLFFILSALTLFMSMEKRKDNSLSHFFTRRFFRIAPLFYLALLFYPVSDYVFAKLQGETLDSISVGNIIGTITFIGNLFNPYWLNMLVPGGWSVTVEMAFYLFVPYLFIKIKDLKRACVFAVLTTAAGTVLTVFLSHYQLIENESIYRNYLFYWFPNQIGIFAFGIALHFLIKRDLKLQRNTAIVLLIAVFVLMLSATQLKGISMFVHILYGLLFVILCYILSQNNFPVLVNKFSIFIGKISFSLYLTHFIVLRCFSFTLNKLGIGGYGWFFEFIILLIFTFGASVLVSMITHDLIEKKGIDFANKLISKKIPNTLGEMIGDKPSQGGSAL